MGLPNDLLVSDFMSKNNGLCQKIGTKRSIFNTIWIARTVLELDGPENNTRVTKET